MPHFGRFVSTLLLCHAIAGGAAVRAAEARIAVLETIPSSLSATLLVIDGEVWLGYRRATLPEDGDLPEAGAVSDNLWQVEKQADGARITINSHPKRYLQADQAALRVVLTDREEEASLWLIENAPGNQKVYLSMKSKKETVSWSISKAGSTKRKDRFDANRTLVLLPLRLSTTSRSAVSQFPVAK